MHYSKALAQELYFCVWIINSRYVNIALEPMICRNADLCSLKLSSCIRNTVVLFYNIYMYVYNGQSWTWTLAKETRNWRQQLWHSLKVTFCFSMNRWWSSILQSPVWGHRPPGSLYPLLITIRLDFQITQWFLSFWSLSLFQVTRKKIELRMKQPNCSPTAILVSSVLSYIRTKCVTMDMSLT